LVIEDLLFVIQMTNNRFSMIIFNRLNRWNPGHGIATAKKSDMQPNRPGPL
jgi:hypothetical protein